MMNKNLSNELHSLEFYQNLNNFLKNRNEIDNEVIEWYVNFNKNTISNTYILY